MKQTKEQLKQSEMAQFYSKFVRELSGPGEQWTGEDIKRAIEYGFDANEKLLAEAVEVIRCYADEQLYDPFYGAKSLADTDKGHTARKFLKRLDEGE